MRECEISDAAEKIIGAYQKIAGPALPSIHDYLLVRERAMTELASGVNFDSPAEPKKETYGETQFARAENALSRIPAKAPKTKQPASPPAPAIESPAVSNTETEKKSNRKSAEPKLSEGMSDFDILKNLKDEWN